MKTICGILILLISALMFAATAAADISRAGLVGEWHFDGDAIDSSGNGNDGMIYGATFVEGKIGKALSLNGVDDYVSLGSWFNYQTFTISMWINPAANQVDYANIIDNNHEYNFNFVMQQRASTVNRYVWAPGDHTIDGDDISCSNRCVNFNLISNWWTYIVITRDANTRESRVFINGEFLSKATGMTDINYPGNQFIRLGTWGHGDRNWNGIIDEVNIYNRALSAAEIKANYEAGKIIITSSISGSEVILDGLSRGTASPSIAVSGIAPGIHTVKCRLSGYSDYETTVNLAASSTVSAVCSLTQAPGSISITSSPSGAEVYLDGTQKGTAPVMLKDIPPGTHIIWCKKTGYEDLQQSIDVTASGVATFTCKLTSLATTSPTVTTITPTPTSTSLILITTPAGITPGSTAPAQTPTSTSAIAKSASITGRILDSRTGGPVPGATVTVDGKSGTTDSNGEYELEVEAGKHSLAVSMQGYETVTRSIIVTEEGTMLDLSLKPASPDSSSLWIVLILLVVVISAGIIYYLYRKKKVREKEEKEGKEKEEKEKKEKEERERKEKEEKERKAKETKKSCMYCHAPLPLGSKFCNECGKKQEEKTRFCMNCGAPMPDAPDLCPKCGKMPPSDVDTKTCKNCAEVIPKVAKFCSACGAGQPE